MKNCLWAFEVTFNSGVKTTLAYTTRHLARYFKKYYYSIPSAYTHVSTIRKYIKV